MVKNLHRLVIKSYLGPFVLTFFIAIFVLLMQFLWKYIDDLVGKGLELSILLELLFYASATFVPMALPLAILLSSIMTFGNLGEHYELVAFKAAGISLQRIMRPLIAVSIIISLSAFFFSNNVLPVANLKFRSLLYDIRNQRPELNIKPGIFYKKIDNYVIKISDKDKDRNMLYNVLIYDHTQKSGNVSVTIADSASMKVTTDENYLVLTMFSGKTYEDIAPEKREPTNKKTYPYQKSYFTKEIILLDLSGFGLKRTDEDLWKENEEMFNLHQLVYTKDSLIDAFEDRKVFFGNNILTANYYRKEIKIDSLKIPIDTMYWYNTDSLFGSLSKQEKLAIIDVGINFARSTQSYISSQNIDFEFKEKVILKHDIELHRKFTLSIACLVLFFIGAPLGAIIRKGGLGMPVVVATLFFIFYYIISITGEKMVKQGIIEPYFGMWLSTIILLPIGIFLTYKSTTDSVLFDLSSYKEIIKKLIGIDRIKHARKQKVLTHYSSNISLELENLKTSLTNLSRLCKEYNSIILNTINFKLVLHNIFSFKHQNKLKEIVKAYRSSFELMIVMGEQNKYLKEKQEVFPNFKLNWFRRKKYSIPVNYLLIIILPVGLLTIIFHYIKLSSLKKKLNLITRISNEILIVLENPDFMTLKND